MRRLAGILALCAFATGVFLSLALLGAGERSGMAEAGCPLMPLETTVCTMSALDHLAAWKAMYTGVPQAPVLLFMLIITALMPMPAVLADQARVTTLTRLGDRALPSPLQELFSSGILNPKLH